MKLKFKQQQYQVDAVMSVVNCFAGQKKESRKDLIARFTRTTDKGTLLEKTEEVEIIACGNHPITLTDTERRTNIRNVQRLNDINYTDDAGLDNFTIEMETGTGKTYVYLRTILELNKEYGFNKFMIVVPSIAIRKGVEKSMEQLTDHFKRLYNVDIQKHSFIYDSGSKKTD